MGYKLKYCIDGRMLIMSLKIYRDKLENKIMKDYGGEKENGNRGRRLI